MNEAYRKPTVIVGVGAVAILVVGLLPPVGVGSYLLGDTYEPLAYVLYIGLAYVLIGGATIAVHRFSFQQALMVSVMIDFALYFVATIVQYVDIFVYEPIANATFMPIPLLTARFDFALSLVPITMALPLGVAVKKKYNVGILVSGSLALISYILAIVVFLAGASGFFPLLLGLFAILAIVEIFVCIPVYLTGKTSTKSD